MTADTDAIRAGRDDVMVRPARSAAADADSTGGTGAPVETPSGGSVDVCVSVTLALSVDDLTIRAAFVVGLAIVALLLTGWRKPARAEVRSPRGPLQRERSGFVVDHDDAPLYRRPGIIRRLFALAASGGIGLLSGVLIAIMTSFALAYAVIKMTSLLTK